MKSKLKMMKRADGSYSPRGLWDNIRANKGSGKAPTPEMLGVDYSSLEKYKSISDTIIYNPAKFKPIFGDKAATSLRAIFKVVKNSINFLPL